MIEMSQRAFASTCLCRLITIKPQTTFHTNNYFLHCNKKAPPKGLKILIRLIHLGAYVFHFYIFYAMVVNAIREALKKSMEFSYRGGGV